MLSNLRRKLRHRREQLIRQVRKWRHTHLRGHARLAHRAAAAVRYLRWLLRRATRQPVTVMFDSVDLTQIPADAPAVAGYVGGQWPTFPQLARLFPRAKRLSIAIAADEDADCLDIEKGDATNAQASEWVKRQIVRGIKRPVVYTSVSNAYDLLVELAHAGIRRWQVRLWTAHYEAEKHICGPNSCRQLYTDADGTQWTSKSHGLNLDESWLTRGFFG